MCENGKAGGGRETRLKGTGSREGSRAVRTWEERGENSGVRRELWKGERRIAGLQPDFDRTSPKFGWVKKREGGDHGCRVKGNRASGNRGAGCGCAQRQGLMKMVALGKSMEGGSGKKVGDGIFGGGRQREEGGRWNFWWRERDGNRKGPARWDGRGVVAGRKRGWGDGQWQRRLPEEGEEDRGAIRKREDEREWGKFLEGKRSAGVGGGAGDGRRWRWRWR